jgi:hypothetical protein
VDVEPILPLSPTDWELWPQNLLKEATFKVIGLRGNTLQMFNQSAVKVTRLNGGQYETTMQQEDGSSVILQLRKGNLVLDSFPERSPSDRSARSAFLAVSQKFRALVKATMKAQAISWDEANEAIFSKFDADKNGIIDIEEFELFAKQLLTGLQSQQLRSVFALMDTRMDGRITIAQFKELIEKEMPRLGYKSKTSKTEKRHGVRNSRKRGTLEAEQMLPLQQRQYFIRKTHNTTKLLRNGRIRERSFAGTGWVERLNEERAFKHAAALKKEEQEAALPFPLLQSSAERTKSALRLYSTGTRASNWSKDLLEMGRSRSEFLRRARCWGERGGRAA